MGVYIGDIMKITLLQVNGKKDKYLNKDVMGGYGENFCAGDSFLAGIIGKLKERGVNFPSTSFGYAAAILQKKGHEVNFSLNQIPLDSELVIIQSSIVDYKTEIEFARKIKKMTGAKIGFIGPFASAMPDIFSKDADFIIIGEPEDIFLRISDTWLPKGIIKSEPIQNLDSLPFPKWDKFPYHNYTYQPIIKKGPVLPIVSSRGCTYFCNYCPYKAFYGAFRERSAKNVIAEIKYLTGYYNIKGIIFRDPIFTANKQRAKEIAQGIIDNGIHIKWVCETHLNSLDKEMLQLLKKAGLVGINVGIESADPYVLKMASRVNAEIKHQENIIKFCDEIGIKVSAFYMIGMQEDTEESIKRTITYAKRLNTHIAQFFIFTPFPGTKKYDELKNQIIAADWEEFTAFNPVFKHKNLSSKQLLKLKNYAFVSYYFRPRYLLKYLKRMYSK